MPTQEAIIALAERLAEREGFAPSWITYPRWTGYAPDFAPMLKRADKYKEWAKAILTKVLPPPPWLAEEDPDFRDPELNNNTPPENPNHLSRAKVRAMRHTYSACRMELERPLPSLSALPKPKQAPTERAIIDLAMRMDARYGAARIPEFMYRYPKWAGYSVEYEAALKEVAILKRDAEAVLLGEKRPPPWLVRKEPERWMPMREVRTAPAPVSLAGASSCLERRAFPCLAAWLLLLSSPAPPPPEARPPPSLTVRGPPCRYTSGDACPVLPPVREKESRSVSRDSLFLKCIA